MLETSRVVPSSRAKFCLVVDRIHSFAVPGAKTEGW